MKRGELYRLAKPSKRDPKKFRVYVVVSRNDLIATSFPYKLTSNLKLND